jgi:hypothetical protein
MRSMAHQNKDAWYWQHRQLSSLIRDWDLSPGCPSDEFDTMSFKLLSALQKGADDKVIGSILESELEVTYGFFSDEFDTDALLAEVRSWWSKQ